jgi:hypothetical protein
MAGAWRLDASGLEESKKSAVAAYLDAPKTLSGIPFCGRLPWGFLWNFQHTKEIFFTAEQTDSYKQDDCQDHS